MNNPLRSALRPVHHGMAMGLLALILGALWAAYMATHHASLHGAFESAEARAVQARVGKEIADMDMDGMDMDGMGMDGMGMDGMAPNMQHHADHAPHASGHAHHGGHAHAGHAHAGGGQHSHSGSLAGDAMQRLLRGHIHFMGIGLLVIASLLLVASTDLKSRGKQALAWTFGLGALLYPPAWILMGFRTVELGPEAAEASVLWLFGPAVALLLGSLILLLLVLAVECTGLSRRGALRRLFDPLEEAQNTGSSSAQQ